MEHLTMREDSQISDYPDKNYP